MKVLEKIKVALLGVAAVAVAATVAIAPVSVSAKSVCRTGEHAGEIIDGECSGDSETDRNLFKTVNSIINVILSVIGIITVVVIILGGIQYVTSAGDPAKTKKAKDTILYGIIGLIIALLAFAIVNFVLGNVFKGNSGSDSGNDGQTGLVMDVNA